MITTERGRGAPEHGATPRPARMLPAWRQVLLVVAHPDDETFGLGAIAARLAAAGKAVHVLCFTHGEASTLNASHAGLHAERARELRLAADELGVASVTLLGYTDGQLAAGAPDELAAHVSELAASTGAEGLLVFDDTGVTGHPDHRAATRAALRAAEAAGLPVLAWALPEAIAAQLRAETGAPFAGQPAGRMDLCVRVHRARQRRAALRHASQISPAAVLWRRLQLQGECEHLRWLRRPEPAREHRMTAGTCRRASRAADRREGT